MIQKLTEFLQKAKKSMKYKIILSFIFFVLVDILVWIFPIQAQNVTLRLYTTDIPDETVVNWKICSDAAYDKETETKTYICNGKASVRVEPDFLGMDSIELLQSDLAGHISKIEVQSGKFVKDDPVIGTVTGGVLFEERDGKSVITADALAKIKKYMHNSRILNIQISLFLFALYMILVLYWLLNLRFKRYQTVGTCAICIGTLIFCIQMSYNHDDVRVSEGSNVESQYFELSDCTSVAEQEFIATAKRLHDINVLLKMDEELDCGVVLELVRVRDGAVVAKDILSTSQYVGNTVLYNFKFDDVIQGVRETFLFRVRCIDNPTDNRLFVTTSEGNTFPHGQFLYNGERMDVDMAMQIFYERLQNVLMTRIICVLLALLLIVCLLTFDIKDEKRQNRICIAIHLFMFCYAVFQMLFYWHYVGNTPDESKHIAYIAYLEQENVLLPDMREMKGISRTYNDGEVQIIEFTDVINYLRHPPLYYHVMRLADAFTFNEDGTIRVEVQKLRLFSMCFGILAMAIIFYIGYTRLKKIPYLHLLYGAVCISVPMLTYGLAGVSNDTFTLLMVSIFFLGLIRLAEHKWDWKTYWLIAIGMTLTLLTKATAGILTALAGALVLLYYLIKEKCFKELMKPAFLTTIPLYLIAVAYYLSVYMEFGTFQPDLYDVMSVEQVRSMNFYTDFDLRSFMDVGNYVNYYLKNFLMTWTGLCSHVSIPKVPNSGISSLTLGLISLWIFPVLCLNKKISKNNPPYTVVIGGMYAATLFTAISQMVYAYEVFIARGWEGSFQSRYYLCGIVLMAFSAAYLVQKLDGNIEGKEKYGILLKRGLFISTLCFVAMLFYEDFIYFLMNFTEYPIYYQ